jgi:hypothetical protein
VNRNNPDEDFEGLIAERDAVAIDSNNRREDEMVRAYARRTAEGTLAPPVGAPTTGSRPGRSAPRCTLCSSPRCAL